MQGEENTGQKRPNLEYRYYIIRVTYFRDISIAMVTMRVNVKKCLDDWRVIQENTEVWELEGNVEGFDS